MTWRKKESIIKTDVFSIRNAFGNIEYALGLSGTLNMVDNEGRILKNWTKAVGCAKYKKRKIIWLD